ncbi:chemotaxis protein CheX [Actinotalea ferrariae]|uniref:chemotaxis protein CheX n=1 Tax=Actinotalea ferrariae TaxID=1386098 RepID=UPI001C8B300C|nr:chemotaxis protein CheX [Actinotalea ferrariae]MBX9245148.1 chemotaxis protein CheX [Actinotalea ferrariae]
MSSAIDISAFHGTDPVLAIAEEVFTAMIDGEPGLVRPWTGDVPPLADEMHAWVDVHGPFPGRVLVSTEAGTAQDLARALLGMGADEAVSDEDLVDALGEVANVVGGNVKALVADPHALGLPVVDRARPATRPEDLLHSLPLDWRGRLVEVGLWTLP